MVSQLLPNINNGNSTKVDMICSLGVLNIIDNNWDYFDHGVPIIAIYFMTI